MLGAKKRAANGFGSLFNDAKALRRKSSVHHVHYQPWYFDRIARGLQCYQECRVIDKAAARLLGRVDPR